MRRPAGTGALLVASAVLSLGGYLVLGTQFGWPAVLDDPGTSALDAFVEAQAWVRFGFYLFLLASLLLIPAAVGLHDLIGRHSPASVSVAVLGILGAFAQMLGWVRWPIAVPGLADAWTDAAATATQREATAAAYDGLNGYAGGALGEHLGWLLQGIWAVGVAILLLRSRRVPRWFALLGLGLAGAWALAVPTATAVGLATLEFWGLNVYTAWYLWLLALGGLLMGASRGGEGQRVPGGTESAARSRASSTRQ
ncbi:hypothetical protein GCM10023168_34580 [Fodinibacter luteus]|uniref:DUF4386 family protein n=1 Tax=Fodinibacter luteus TaxID=552064 RepID=A0ABP8KQM1_9MICO